MQFGFSHFALVTVHALSACCSLPFLPLGISSLLGLLLHGCREVPLTSISLITCCCSHFICFTSLVSVGSYLSHCTQQFIPYWRILLTPFITWQLQQLPFSVTKINDYAVCSCSYSVSLWSCHHTLLSHLSKWLMMGIVLEKLQWTEYLCPHCLWPNSQGRDDLQLEGLNWNYRLFLSVKTYFSHICFSVFHLCYSHAGQLARSFL